MLQIKLKLSSVASVGPGTVGFEGNLLPKGFTEAVSVVFSLYYL